MATIKEILERRKSVKSQIDVYEEILSQAYDMKGLKETHGEDAVDDVLTAIDETLLAPLREELERIDKMEVGDGQGKKQGARSAKKRKQSATVQGDKAAGAKTR